MRRAVGAASDSESPSTPRSLVEMAARCPTIDVQGVVLDPVDLGVERESHAGFHGRRHPGHDPLKETRFEGLGNVHFPPADAAIVRVEDVGAVGAVDVEQRLCVAAQDAVPAAADPLEETRPERAAAGRAVGAADDSR